MDKKELLEKLLYLHNDWKDEIPKEIIHSNDKNNKYKCRIAWFQIITSSIDLGEHYKLFTKKSKRVRDNFKIFVKELTIKRKNYIYIQKLGNDYPVNKKEIAKGNAVLKSMIKDLMN